MKNIVKRGGTVSTILEETLNRTKSIPRSEITILQIACGICNLNNKVNHAKGFDLIPNNAVDVVAELINFKSSFRAAFPRSLVGIATIPIIDYCKIFRYNVEFLHQESSINTIWELEAYQQQLSDKLADVNTRIVQENKLPQHIPGIGDISPCNLFWHQNIEKTYYCGKGANKKTCKRIPDSATIDGCHASASVSNKWYEGLHNCYMTNIGRIEAAE